MTNRQTRQVSRQVRADMRVENTGEAGKTTIKCPSDTESKGLTCKECGKRVPQRNNQVNFACQSLGYCRYCYRMNYPKRRWTQRTEGRKELELPLTREDRIWHAEHAFEGMEQIYWSKDFLAEWREFIEALKRGELKC